MKPKFEHDCEACTFLGRYSPEFDVGGEDYRDMTFDLYHCLQGEVDGSNQTIVARFSDDGPDYMSLPVELCGAMQNRMNPLAMGLRRAMEIGLTSTRGAS